MIDDKISVLLSNNDEARSKWFNPADIRDVTEVIVNRGKIPISASMVRGYMVADTRREWQKWVNPKLHKMYSEIRDELMSVPFYSGGMKVD